MFQGKFKAKWAKRTRAENEEKARGIAKAKAKAAASTASSLVEKIKKKQKERRAARKKEYDAARPSRRTETADRPDATEKCEASPWHDKVVRVVSEGTFEGQRGGRHERPQVHHREPRGAEVPTAAAQRGDEDLPQDTGEGTRRACDPKFWRQFHTLSIKPQILTTVSHF